MLKGVCFPDRTTTGYGSSDRYSGTPSGVEPIEKKRCRRSTHKQMQQNDAWTWHVQMLVFGLMQDATKLVEAHLNQRFKCKFKMKHLKCPYYVFTYTACISWFFMHVTRINGFLAFFDHFSYINYFILSYGWIIMIFWSLGNILEFPELK